MKLFLFALLLLLAKSAPMLAAEKPTIADKAYGPPITVMVLYNGPGVPAGWADSTTRPDATDLCNKLIASQSKQDATPTSRSRCIIQVQE